MNRCSTLTFLFLCIFLLNQARAEIEFVYGIKEQAFKQSGNTPPQNPVEWSFGAGASGNEQLTAVSVTPLGSEIPIMLMGEGGGFDLDTGDFTGKAALDAAYPNGQLSFTVTDGGSSQNLGPFNINGDSYPETPYFINITDLYAHDLGADFELSWNAFSSAESDDRILIQVWDNNTDEEIIFEFLPASATSYVIPGDTLTPNNAYDFDIIFVRETDGLATPETIIGYLSTTSFYFTTYESDTELAFYKWQRNVQTGADTIEPGSPAYRPYATVLGQSNSVTYAEVSSRTIMAPLANTPPASNSWSLSGPFVSKEDLDNSYPAGDINFGLVENDAPLGYGWYYLPGDAYPAAPQFQNFTELIAFDATQSQSIMWNAPPTGVDRVSLFIIDDVITVWSQDFDPATTSVELPAMTLDQNKNYILAIRFWATTTTGKNPTAALGYMSSTAMGIQTSADGGGEPGIYFVYAVKEREFKQDGDNTLKGPFSWGFSAGVTGGNNVTGGSVAYLGGADLFEGEFGDYGTENDNYASQAELNAAYPDGSITLNVTVDGSNQVVGTFDLSGDAYPPAPQILNPGDLSSHDLSQPFTINWSAFPNYDPEDQVIIEVWNVTDEQDLLFEFLPPETTSYEIPGNTFSPESQYELSVLFINETDGLETPEPDMVIGYLTRTRVVLSTSTSDTELFFYKFLRYEQVGGGSESLEENGYLTSASVTANSNSVTFAMLNTVTGSFQLNNPSVNPFFLNTLWNDKAEMDAAYPSGEFHFYLEENGSGRSYAPYYLPPDAYPVPAVIENFSELEIFDASMDQTVSWSPAGEDVTQILVRVTEGLQEVWSMQLDPSATSVVIPANSLAQYKNYRLAVGFWSKQTGSEFPAASLGYTTTTFMSVLTTPPVIDFAGWVQFRFSQQQQENQDIVGQDADPDGDKLTNYLEYLIGADPLDPNSGLTYRVEGTTLIINPVPGGATWELRGSSDFINWSPLAAESYEVFFESIYIYLDTLPSPTFIRLVFSDA